MKKLFYPAVFHIAEEGGYWVTFPDFPECLTQGENMQEAYDMAIDALGLILTDDINDHKELPEPSNITHVDDGVVVIIPYDYLEYNRKYHNKSIKKTLSIAIEFKLFTDFAGCSFKQNSISLMAIILSFGNTAIIDYNILNKASNTIASPIHFRQV